MIRLLLITVTIFAFGASCAVACDPPAKYDQAARAALAAAVVRVTPATPIYTAQGICWNGQCAPVRVQESYGPAAPVDDGWAQRRGACECQYGGPCTCGPNCQCGSFRQGAATAMQMPAPRLAPTAFAPVARAGYQAAPMSYPGYGFGGGCANGQCGR